MFRCLLRRANLTLHPVNRPRDVARLYVEEGRPVGVLRLMEPHTGRSQRICCRVYLNPAGDCYILLERPTPLQHALFGDLQVPAGWWLAREEPWDRHEAQTPSTLSNGSVEDATKDCGG